MTLTLKHHGFELRGSTYMWIFHSTVLQMYFLNDSSFLLAYFIVGIQYIMHKHTQYMLINSLCYQYGFWSTAG